MPKSSDNIKNELGTGSINPKEINLKWKCFSTITLWHETGQPRSQLGEKQFQDNFCTVHSYFIFMSLSTNEFLGYVKGLYLYMCTFMVSNHSSEVGTSSVKCHISLCLLKGHPFLLNATICTVLGTLIFLTQKYFQLKYSLCCKIQFGKLSLNGWVWNTCIFPFCSSTALCCNLSLGEYYSCHSS